MAATMRFHCNLRMPRFRAIDLSCLNAARQFLRYHEIRTSQGKTDTAISGFMVVTEAKVRRGGEKLRIASVQLVPGHVVLLRSGDRVPADLRLLQQRSLQVEEAGLTGESVPVAKQTDPLPAEAILVDRTNLALAGTIVSSGQGEGVVFATGDTTEMGRIAGMM